MEGKRSQEKLKKEKGKEVETRGMGRRVHSLKEGGEMIKASFSGKGNGWCTWCCLLASTFSGGVGLLLILGPCLEGSTWSTR